MKTCSVSQKLVAIALSLFCGLAVFSCAKKSESSGQSYSFSSTASVSLKGSIYSTLALLRAPAPDQDISRASAADTMCQDSICFTPSSLKGKLLGTGFLIQSSGNGMVAYFGKSEWSSVTGTSESYTVDLAAPVTSSGTLTCCGGTGDLSSSNTYISDIIYLFGYIDATFAVTGVTGNVAMNATYTVRFVLADDAFTGAKRGDILLKNSGSGNFEWMNSTNSALSTTRPTTPVTMDTAVVNWTNPFGSTQGNQSIPVINSAVIPPSGGVFAVTETELKTVGRTYTFDFNLSKFIIFPSLRAADINLISTLKELLTRVHFQGLKHSSLEMGASGTSKLTVTN